MQTNNPVWKDDVFQRSRTNDTTMTFYGTLAKISVLFLLLLGTAIYTWMQHARGENIELLIGTGIIGSLIIAIFTIFIPKISPYTAPVYAILEGFAIGGISAYLEASYPGIVIQAVSITFSILAALLLLYATGLIKVTKKFRIMVISATLGILMLYLVHFILRLFFQIEIPFLHSSGPVGIAINAFIAAIAALNLVLDFDFITRGIKKRSPKYLEWYAAFGLMITLVWLYFEILRLLQKLRK